MFATSFPNNGWVAPPLAKQKLQGSTTAFSSGGFAGPPVSIAPPVQPINPFDFSVFGGFAQGFYTPQVVNPITFITQSTATSIFLTATSAAYQKVAPTAYDCAWYLPVASSVAPGAFFILENAGLFPMPILSYGAILLGWVMPGQTVQVRMQQVTSPDGLWKVMTGERDRDAGLNWWGALTQMSTSVTGSFMVSCALSSQYGFIAFYNGTDYVAVGYTVAENRIVLGASSTVITAASAATGNSVDVCALSSTKGAIGYLASGADFNVRTVDINTSTLALTLGTELQVLPTPANFGGLSMDKISSTLFLVIEGDSSSTLTRCRTISVSGTTCVANGAATISATRCGHSAVRVLSSTLAHVVYDDTSNNLSVNRIVLAGTVCTPGTPVAVTSRLCARSNSSTDVAYDLGKASATSTWHVCISSFGTAYGEVYTDTGSAITVTETLLQTGAVISNTTSTIPEKFAPADLNGCGLVTCYDNSMIVQFYIARVNGTAVSLSPVLQQPPNMAAVPVNAFTSQLAASNLKNHVYNNTFMFPFVKGSASRPFLQPITIS